MTSFIKLALPTPRFQFRWEPIKHESGANWICIYELVIGLREHDIRRGRRNKKQSVSLVLGRTRATRTGPPIINKKVDTPFRDGVHVKWDRAELGNFRVFGICGAVVTEYPEDELTLAPER